MNERKKEQCPIAICPEHSHTGERIAMLEKGLTGLEATMLQVARDIKDVHSATRAEFKIIREDITNGLLKRQHPLVTIVITALFGALCTVSTILIEYLLNK